MKTTSTLVALGALLLAAGAAQASAIQDSNAVFDLSANTASGGTPPTGFFSINGPTGVDHVASTWWWYRLAGETQETALSNPISDVITGGGAHRLLEYSIPDVATILVRFEVSSTGANSGTLVQRVTVTNKAGNNISVSLFNYLNLDLGGDAGGDQGHLVDTNLIGVEDTIWSATWEGTGAAAHQAALNDTTFFGLSDTSATNLNGTGLPLTGDGSYGYQWNVNAIRPEFSRSVVSTLSIVVIPEPSAVAGLAAIAPMLMRRRRA